MKLKYRALAFAATALVLGHGAWAGEAEAKKWVDSEFQPSTLSKPDRRKITPIPMRASSAMRSDGTRAHMRRNRIRIASIIPAPLL